MSANKYEETNYPFYMIFSSRTPENLTDLINDYYSKNDNSHAARGADKKENDLQQFHLCVPDKFKGQSTSRTIISIDPAIFEALKTDEEFLSNFKIEKFQMRPHFYPNEKYAENYNFYIRLPKNLTLTKCQNHLIERMSSLSKLGMFTKNDYVIRYPNMNRIQDKHNGHAYIYFNNLKPENRDRVALSRVFINNTKWIETNQEVHCHWVRNKSQTDKIQDEKGNDVIEVITSKKEKDLDIEVVKTDKVEKVSNVWEEKNGKHK